MRLFFATFALSLLVVAIVPAQRRSSEAAQSIVRTFRSRLDGTEQSYHLFVPAARRNRHSITPKPLLVTLHGFGGNAGDYFRETFGLRRPPRVSQAAFGANGPLPTNGPFFVLAPTGRGQTHYRFAGEVDVFEAIEDAKRHYPIDASRIYVTGGSMGGTGAAYLPFRNPGVFAASAAMAGYHDQRVRSDTRVRDLSEWERFLLAERSDVDWAENARHLPMLLIRGTRDRPLEWTRSLVSRLTSLGIPFEHREPVSGHNVWSEFFGAPSGFAWFQRHHLESNPDSYSFVTASERHGEAYHLRDVRRERPDAFAKVDFERRGDDVTVRTDNVRSMTLTSLFRETLRLVVDGEAITRRDGGVIMLTKIGGHWSTSDTEGAGKRLGVSGPIRDVFHEPLVFVYGGRDEDERGRLREVARVLANPTGWNVSYPLLDAREFDESAHPHATFVFVGEASSHAPLASRVASLPIRADVSAIALGDRRIEGNDLGTAFVVPDPSRENRSLLVVTGTSVAGIEHATALPDLLPDYVVFDASVEAMRGRFAGGGSGASFLAAGFFAADWSLSPSP